MCAGVAGQRGRRVLVIEHADQVGKKILISGGGRCNFTNLNTTPDRFISANPHYAKSALGRYTARDFLDLVEGHGIAWHDKTLGQLFCDGRASQIVDLLLAECAKGAVEIGIGRAVETIEHRDGKFQVTVGKAVSAAPILVIATGGPSIPKLGATDLSYRVARQFGLKVVEPRPALVPLTLGGEEALFSGLSGVATDVIARAGKAEFREAALFTHRGLSGPAILQISSYWRHGEQIAVNFVPDLPRDWLLYAKREQPRSGLRRCLAQLMPDRLAEALAKRTDLPSELGNCSDVRLRNAGRSTRRAPKALPRRK
jgi:predicted Rossmann fold flavoprotein